MKPSVGAIHELPLPMVLAITHLLNHTCIQQCRNSDGGTDITWTSHYDILMPIVGSIVGLCMKGRYEVAFRQILQNTSHIFDSPKGTLRDREHRQTLRSIAKRVDS